MTYGRNQLEMQYPKQASTKKNHPKTVTQESRDRKRERCTNLTSVKQKLITESRCTIAEMVSKSCPALDGTKCIRVDDYKLRGEGMQKKCKGGNKKQQNQMPLSETETEP